MRPNLLFLENHSDFTSRNFILENLDKLKAIGYSSIFIEMPSTMTITNVINLLENQLAQVDICIRLMGYESAMKILSPANVQLISQGMTTKDYIDLQRKSLKFYQDLKKSDINCKFIDDEVLVNEDAMTGSLANIPKRDAIMADRIKAENIKQQGGIIVIVGFLHKTLAQFLLVNLSAPLETLILSTKENILGYRFTALPNMEDDKSRESFYGHKVHFFNIEEKSKLEDFLTKIKKSLSPINSINNSVIQNSIYKKISIKDLTADDRMFLTTLKPSTL